MPEQFSRETLDLFEAADRAIARSKETVESSRQVRASSKEAVRDQGFEFAHRDRLVRADKGKR